MSDRVTIEKVAWEVEVPIVKTAADQRLAFGWANVTVDQAGQIIVDKQDDFTLTVDLEEAAYGYVAKSREAGRQHAQLGVGTLVESVVFTKEKIEAMGLPGEFPEGWWVGYRVTDDQVWSGVKDGTYGMFSIGGMGKRNPV